MAQIYCSPDESDIERSEQVVLTVLKGLPAEWHVFHSVAWQSLRGRRQGDGEADFVLLHPTVGLLVLEVKGGGIDVVEGRWTSTNNKGTHNIKDPFQQATDSKYALLRYCENLTPQPVRCAAGHCVVFPDISVGEGIGTYGPRSLILDRNDLKDVLRSIERVCRYEGLSSNLKKAEIELLKRLLAPTVKIRRTVRDQIGDTDQQLLELTRRQVEVLRASRLNRRLLVRGGAGTGKTVLAIERARSQAEEGGKILYVCYNKPLADHVAKSIASCPNIYATTFHGLCSRAIREAGAQWPAKPDADWWKKGAPAMLIDAAATVSLNFDSIIVDEGQDFESSWLYALELLLTHPKDSPICIFADNHQALYSRDWAIPSDWPVCELDLNCRNTRPIAEKVAAVYGDSVRSLGVPGLAVAFLEAKRDLDSDDLIQHLSERLITDERLAAEQITILSNNTEFISRVRANCVIGDYVVCELGQRGIVAESIARFKGLESEVVLLVLPSTGTLTSPELYVGLSRARILLYIIGPRAAGKQLGLCS